VFFIDTSGALCSRSAGHAVDVEGAYLLPLILAEINPNPEDRLVLRHRRPVSHPFPNAYAHPLPKFSYSPQTGEITVHFTCDPAYPLPDAPASNAWKSKTYLLTSIPMRRPRTLIDDASEFLASTILTPISWGRAAPQATPEQVFNGDIDLNEDDVVEEERGEEGEVDDSPEAGRKVRVIGVVDRVLNEKARNRRRWVVTPLRTVNAKTTGSS
jgi:hypothetical protein